MTQIEVLSELNYHVTSATSFVFNIAPAITDHQKILRENLTISPLIDYTWCALNDYGSRGIRLMAQPSDLQISYAAEIALAPETDAPMELDEVDYPELPVEVLPFLNPSRYCESDLLGQFAWQEFGQIPSGYSRVKAIADWVNKYIAYVAGTTNASSSACDVLIQRTGVCRDFAHIAIALCRSLGIPARYISGYALGLEPPDFHGSFEAFLNERWYLFDATKLAPVSGFVRIGVGRDAADAPFSTIVGQSDLVSMSVKVTSSHAVELTKDKGGAVSTA